MIVKWGTELADKMGAEVCPGILSHSLFLSTIRLASQCVVEASVQGRHLYEQCGFVVVEDITMPISAPEGWNDPRKQRYFFMRRPAIQSQS